jgi:hypothetical protein
MGTLVADEESFFDIIVDRRRAAERMEGEIPGTRRAYEKSE